MAPASKRDRGPEFKDVSPKDCVLGVYEGKRSERVKLTSTKYVALTKDPCCRLGVVSRAPMP